ncbi:hypothetical protein [Limisalsivibrio acetivorans]|uniref:hypothetical protein n=1 Tax=Limisalsivibrio acetivorans TaxID=1304888 RepID=UPI0003B46111|nr:hypothetical protein [Limisalsivibrio acetivorans]
MGRIKAVCKHCGIDLYVILGRKAACPGCKRPYTMRKDDIRTAGGLVISDLAVEDVKLGVKKGRFLSGDSICSRYTPWMRIDDTPFAPGKREEKRAKPPVWMYTALVLSILINLVLFGIIYFQHMRIETITR